MKKIFIIVLTLVFVLIFVFNFVVYKNATEKSGVRFTTDINNYNSEKYPIPNYSFPLNLPTNAEVVSFSYFNHWHEVIDIYLELTFDTVEEMEDYLYNIKNIYASENKGPSITQKNGLFVETNNIYDDSFEEMFLTSCVTMHGEDTYTGYEILADAGESLYDCNFGVISYSFEELTVVHSYVYGGYNSNIHNHVPKYFTRFNVPLTEENQRIFYLE